MAKENRGNDMPAEWQQEVRLLFSAAIKECDGEDQIAREIKEAFDKKHRGSWHCVVGKFYGSNIAYESGTHFYERIGPFTIELWRCTSKM